MSILKIHEKTEKRNSKILQMCHQRDINTSFHFGLTKNWSDNIKWTDNKDKKRNNDRKNSTTNFQ